MTPARLSLLVLLFGALGCGPVAIVAGVNELLKDENPNLVDPGVEVLAEDGSAAPASFAEAVAPRFLVRTNKRGAILRVVVETAPFTALPDANGCPRDGSGDLLAREGVDLGALQEIADGEYGVVYDVDLTRFPAGSFEADARIWARVRDADGRIECVNHTFRIDRRRPAAVEGVTAVARRARQLEVRWTPSVEGDVVGYRIRWDVPHENGEVTRSIPHAGSGERTPGMTYRNPVDEGTAPADGVFVAGREANAATIPNLWGLRTHFVQVVAVDRATNESAPAAEREIAVRTRSGADGRFRAPVSIAGLGGSAAAADFDRDGLVDFLRFRCGGTATIDLYRASRAADGTLQYALGRIEDDTLFDCGPSQANGGTAGVVAEDFDGDGFRDFAAVSGDGVFVARLGPLDAQGRPEIRGTSQVDLGSVEAVGLVRTDINRDGRADLVVPFEFDGVSNSKRIGHVVLIGNGDGTFTELAGSRIVGIADAVASQARSIAAADFDNDGITDYVVADVASVSVVRLRPGGFSPRVDRIGTQGAPGWMAVAEFTDDRLPDLAVSNLDGSLVVLAGVGDGTFALQASLDGGGGPVVAGDFDGDTIADLAVSTAQGVRLFRGGGADHVPDGSFFALPAATAPAGRRLLALDVDGDRLRDLVTLGEDGASTAVLLGRGTVGVGLTGFHGDLAIDVTELVDPIEGREGKPDVTVWPRSGDIDGNGIPDLVVGVRVRGAGTLLVYPGLGVNAQGRGAFGSPVASVNRLATPIDVLAVGDFSGDGRVDVATAETFPVTTEVPTWFPGTPGGGLGAGNALDIPIGRPAEYLAHDMDLDGAPDLVAIGNHQDSQTQAVIYHHNGSGALASYVVPNLTNPVSTGTVGDFDGDGLPDLVARNDSFGTNELFLVTGGRDENGAIRGLSESIRTVTGNGEYALAAADLNDDGRDDLLLATSRGFLVRLATGQFASSFEDAVVVDDEGLRRRNYVHVADWNADGHPDALVGGKVHLSERDASGRATGAFASTVAAPFDGFLEYGVNLNGSANGRMTIADFDADGIPDIAYAKEVEFTGELVIVFGAGRIEDR